MFLYFFFNVAEALTHASEVAVPYELMNYLMNSLI